MPKPGEIMLAFKIALTFKAGVVPATTSHIVVQHKMCLKESIGEAPLEQYERIRERLAAGGPLFDDNDQFA